MNLEQSETLQNLINAFAGESQARNRYTFYAKQAKKEGYEHIAQVFLDTAENEREHAKLFYKHIPNDRHFKVTGEYPFFLGNTLENLFSATEGEREEWEYIYKQGARIAKEEGFDKISNLFTGILEIEKRHSHRFEAYNRHRHALCRRTAFDACALPHCRNRRYGRGRNGNRGRHARDDAVRRCFLIRGCRRKVRRRRYEFYDARLLRCDTASDAAY